ncbi:MAG TPA: carboxylesterase [Chromatiales bacterium]|nr:carboxylesterase [Chromatiales bacterium]
MADLQTFEHETGPDPVAAIIWMHGLGADAHDFEPVVPVLDLGPDRPVRFVFPNAPERPVTINAGMRMRAWYDIAGQSIEHREDEAGIRAAAQQIGSLIQREFERGLTANRILLAGFSQGGAIALFTGLRYPQGLGGIIALSCYLPLADTLAAEASADAIRTPIFMAHGEADNVLPLWIGQASRDRLLAAGYQVEWHSYPIMHTVDPQELMDLRAFLTRRISPRSC